MGHISTDIENIVTMEFVSINVQLLFLDLWDSLQGRGPSEGLKVFLNVKNP